MNYQSTFTVSSKLPDFEGVLFTVRRVSEGVRRSIAQDLAAPRARVREILGDTEDLWASAPGLKERMSPPRPQAPDQEADPLPVIHPPDFMRKIRDLTDQMDLATTDIDQAWVRRCVVRIEGMDIDGEPATIESFIEIGPLDLYREILAAVRVESGLSEDERKNSESPTTSSAQVDGATTATSAPPASAEVISKGATAPDTSPSE